MSTINIHETNLFSIYSRHISRERKNTPKQLSKKQNAPLSVTTKETQFGRKTTEGGRCISVTGRSNTRSYLFISFRFVALIARIDFNEVACLRVIGET